MLNFKDTRNTVQKLTLIIKLSNTLSCLEKFNQDFMKTMIKRS